MTIRILLYVGRVPGACRVMDSGEEFANGQGCFIVALAPAATPAFLPERVREGRCRG